MVASQALRCHLWTEDIINLGGMHVQTLASIVNLPGAHISHLSSLPLAVQEETLSPTQQERLSPRVPQLETL